MASDRIVGYTFNAESLCPSCAAAAVGWNGREGNPHTYIDKAGRAAGFDVDDEHNFDSSDWPKVIFECQVEDSEQRCGGCGQSLVD